MTKTFKICLKEKLILFYDWNILDLFRETVDTFGAVDIVLNSAGVVLLEEWGKMIRYPHPYESKYLFSTREGKKAIEYKVNAC